MKLNSITYHLIFCTALITQFLFPMNLQQEYQAGADSFDRCIECMAQQDEHFARENAYIVQQVHLSIGELRDVIAGIDHDRNQLLQGAVCPPCRSCFLQQQRNEAQWIMLGHTREHIEQFVALFQAYAAVYHTMPDAQSPRKGHELIGRYLDTLNKLFNMHWNSEEIQFLKESELVDKGLYALVRTREFIGSHGLQMLYKQAFDNSLKQRLEPYDFCPRSPGPRLHSRTHPNGEQITVPNYLFAHAARVFAIQF